MNLDLDGRAQLNRKLKSLTTWRFMPDIGGWPNRPWFSIPLLAGKWWLPPRLLHGEIEAGRLKAYRVGQSYRVNFGGTPSITSKRKLFVKRSRSDVTKKGASILRSLRQKALRSKITDKVKHETYLFVLDIPKRLPARLGSMTMMPAKAFGAGELRKLGLWALAKKSAADSRGGREDALFGNPL